MSKFSTKWDRPIPKKEINSGRRHVDLGGYIPPKQLIQNMMDAGVSLADFRRGLYFPEADKDDVTPVYADKIESEEYLKKVVEKKNVIQSEKRDLQIKQRKELERMKIIQEEDARRNAERNKDTVLPEGAPE